MEDCSDLPDRDDFLEQLEARWRQARAEGIDSTGAPPTGLVDEIAEEVVDIAAWSLPLYQRVRRLGRTLERLKQLERFVQAARDRIGTDGRAGHGNAHGTVQWLHAELAEIEGGQPCG